jgi:glutamine amidotransferase
MTGVIDYGVGNLRSVVNALTQVGDAACLVSTPDALQDCDRAILPGVGAYSAAMQRLTADGFPEAIAAFVASRRPFLGICLGMQLLSTTGSEPSSCAGLGIIPGAVSKLVVRPGTPLPHVGWNGVTLRAAHPLFAGVRATSDFYFVHSYAFTPVDSASVLTESDYDGSFVSGVAKGNVVGLQFHPEKSQVPGLQVLRNFSNWDGGC